MLKWLLPKKGGAGKQSSKAFKKPQEIPWQKSEGGKVYRFIYVKPERERIIGLSAVFVLWHSGVRPAWVYVGRTDDLGATHGAINQVREIMQYDASGGLFMTWAAINADYQDGVVLYLRNQLHPLIMDDLVGTPVNPEAVMIPVVPPVSS